MKEDFFLLLKFQRYFLYLFTGICGTGNLNGLSVISPMVLRCLIEDHSLGYGKSKYNIG
jgi:hypothetical protein